MLEHCTFDPANPPEWLDSNWWRETPNCNHLDNRVHRLRLMCAAFTACTAADIEETRSIVDLGAGDGGLLSLLPKDYCEVSYGYEIITDSVRYANDVRGVDVRQANVVVGLHQIALQPIAVMTEMLEHLADPHMFLRRLSQTGTIKSIVISSPHSETPDYHEWNHAWVWDREGYAKLVTDNGFEIVEHFDAEWSQIIHAKVAAR